MSEALFIGRSLMKKPAKATALSPAVVELEGDFEHQFIYTRGIRLHAVTAGDPQHPLIILLHDAYGGWFDFRAVLPKLAANGWFAVALDLRGYGMSDKPPSNYDHRHVTGDISGVIRSLGHQRAHLFGAGAGAAIAWLCAAAYSEQIQSITTIGAIHPLDMRRAIALRPWLFGDTLPLTLYYRQPRFLQKLWGSFAQRSLVKDLQHRTARHFHDTAEFHAELTLRQRAWRIGSTRQAREKTVRYVVNVPPVSWATLKVTCPVFLLTDPSAQSHYFLQRAENRVTGELSAVSMPTTGRLPHIEAPETFVATLHRVLRP